MKILVTGSNGLLGQKLTPVLLNDKTITPCFTSRGKTVLPGLDSVFKPMDITDADAVDTVFNAFKPDVVINTAAMTMVDQCETDRDACWLANVTSVENLVSASRAVNAHFIHISTDFIFDGSHGPLDEQAQPRPVNFYGESKLAAETVVMNSGLSWSILRTVLVYGITNDMSRSNIVLWVKDNLEKGKTIKVVNDQWRTPTLAEDLAMGCYLAAKKRAKGVYNISGKDFLSPYDIAIKTADFFGLDKSLITAVDSNTFTQPARRPLKTGFIIDKARKELGYEPHSFIEGIKLLSEQILVQAAK
ncbi:SDR family oxidoreductase [Fulvivirgaceae bacterium PWU4]|uniref:dTDP-4-dehydrorhamnose reductase n=1 Tax=Chryseosolibacter histidini TaxID=2782349 RepID=A0AAP2GKL4_9BACT|nr:SDR family oxidoreductase [Chryseosolibacter histidini]MBT1699174.1 SDR family oxidoreductase [Chryseosolibacter histidini]